MAYEVRATPQFESDYDSVLAYLVNALGTRSGALRLLDGMERLVEAIGDNPGLNAISSKAALRKLDYREALVCGYVVLYAVVDDVVFLMRMFHQSQDYEHLLR